MNAQFRVRLVVLSGVVALRGAACGPGCCATRCQGCREGCCQGYSETVAEDVANVVAVKGKMHAQFSVALVVRIGVVALCGSACRFGC